MKVMKFVLAVLIAVNVFLLVLQFGLGRSDFSNQAKAQVVAGSGRYIAATSGRNVLWLIDESSQKMNLYKFDDVNNRLERRAQVNLRTDFFASMPTRPISR